MGKARALIFGVSLAVVGAVMTAPTAQAGEVVPRCEGTRVWSEPLRAAIDRTKTAGRMEYWRASGGRKCVMVYDLVAGAHKMEARIWKSYCPHTSETIGSAYDEGVFETYAGGAQVVGPDKARSYLIGGTVMLNGIGYHAAHEDRRGC